MRDSVTHLKVSDGVHWTKEMHAVKTQGKEEYRGQLRPGLLQGLQRSRKLRPQILDRCSALIRGVLRFSCLA